MIRCTAKRIASAGLLAACAAASTASAATFDTFVTIDVPQTEHSIAIMSAAVEDLNADGRSDVAMFVANNSGFFQSDEDYKIHLYEQGSDGTLRLARSLPARWDGAVRYAPEFMTVADLDADGLPEILLLSDADIVIMGRQANGDYRERTRFTMPSWVPFSSGITHVDDIDGDGHADLVLHANGHLVYLLRGDGALGFSAPTYILSYGMTVHGDMTVGDFDGDGRQDLAALQGNVFGGFGISWGDDSPQRFSAMRAVDFGEYAPPAAAFSDLVPQSVAFGDFDKNGKPDIAYSYFEMEEVSLGQFNLYHTIALREAAPDRSLGDPRSFRIGLGSQSPHNRLIAADVDADGDTDLVSRTNGVVEFIEWRNNSLRPLRMPGVPSTGNTVDGENVFVADLSGDGCLDIAIASLYKFSIFPAASCASRPASQPPSLRGGRRQLVPGPTRPGAGERRRNAADLR